jgi:cytochrome c-type biogenesis protein CcmH
VRKPLLALLLALSAAAAHAGEAQPLAADPALEKRVMALSEELRCLVCQNQTIAESHAELAVDLRNQVREQLAAGRTEKQVTDYMVERYGDFVLYRPPVKGLTWLLWGGPFLLGIGGMALLFSRLRRRTAAVEAETVPQDQLERAAALLDATPDNKEIR